MRRFYYLILVTLIPIAANTQDTIKIMPLGNSITQAENQGVNSYNSWRRQLYMELNTIVQAPDTFDFVGSVNFAFPGVPFPDDDFDPDHEGHWGWRIDEILDSLGGWIQLPNVGPPDFALVHLGSNDCFQNQSVTSSVFELEQVIDTLRAFNPDITILLAQIIPSRIDSLCIEELNDSIAVLAAMKNTIEAPVVLVDQNSGFSAVTDTYDDPSRFFR